MELLDQGFSLPPGKHYLDDFPVWDPQYKTEKIQSFIHSDSGVIVGNVSARLAILNLNGVKIQIGIIGAVATAESHRGKGIASRLLERAIHWLELNDVHAIFLWGSNVDFYGKFGFQYAGIQVRAELNDWELEGSENPSVSFKGGYTPEIFTLAQQRRYGLIHEETDESWFSKHKNVQWITAWQSGKMKAFIGCGRGIDLPNMIHEWGGNSDVLKTLLLQYKKFNPTAQLMGSIELLIENGFTIKKSAPSLVEEYMCLMKIVKANEIEKADPEFPKYLWLWGLDSA